MAMKLFAHVLWGETAEASADPPAGSRSADLRRWVLRDLVVRRDGYAPWGLAHRATSGAAAGARREPSAEPFWADTQPWCHK